MDQEEIDLVYDREVFVSPHSVTKRPSALSKNPQIAWKKFDFEETSLDVSKAKYELWPQLDLDIQYSTRGLSTEYDVATDHLTEGDFPSWQVKLVFSMPLERNQAQGLLQEKISQKNIAEANFLKSQKVVEMQEKSLGDKISLSQEIRSRLLQRLKIESEKVQYKKKAVEIGRISFADFDEALESLNQTQLRVDAELVSLKKNEAALKALYGEFWQ